jgi:flavorubredoxin
MAEAIIIYDSKYGNTGLVAKTITEGLRSNNRLNVVVVTVKDLLIDQVNSANIVLLGSPNHMGRPTANISKLIDKVKAIDLNNKTVSFFDTYMFSDYEKAINRMEAEFKKSLGIKLVPGLSIRVKGMKGPIAEGEIDKARNFGITIANGLPV